jgi:pyruvate kinase
MKAKIICTIGPSTNSYDRLKELAKAGMNCARLNFSHGSHEEHGQTIRRIREVSRDIGIEIAIMQDLPGPKMGIGKVKNNSIYLRKGSMIRLTKEDILGDEERISVTYKDLDEFVRVGTNIFLADGSIKLRVVDINDDIICCVE